MEFDKLRGDYKNAMESIDLSRDSRDRILSNIRLEDLSVPAEKVKTRKRVPLFVVIPVATAVFAALIVAGIVLTSGGKTMTSSMEKIKDEQMVDNYIAGESVEQDAEAAGLPEEIETNAAQDAALNFYSHSILPIKPDTRDKSYTISGNVDTKGVLTIGEDCSIALTYLPFTEYTDGTGIDAETMNSVKIYVNNQDKDEYIMASLNFEKSTAEGVIQTTVVDGHEVIFRGDSGKITSAEIDLSGDRYVVVESTKDYDLDQWLKIVGGVKVPD